ncbi:hypothetical protein [Agrobacterium vitis]|uniref:HNH endonuclease n=1 Tax=Agrobacterium vitis TaxID=373 RepID=A0AAE2USC5_AGRVI|nr:hypothetical protein [Agrobacterium vitis]MBF2715833.1 hypothetical protein [Agrobacterium vitis]
MKSSNRPSEHEFSSHVKKEVAQRAGFVCSRCKARTVGASAVDTEHSLSVGVAAHIHAASQLGPRYNPLLRAEETADISNAIHLCASCSVLIDKNGGQDFSPENLRKIKTDHESEMFLEIGRQPENKFIDVAGTHEASGIGNVTGLEINQSVRILPGTVVRASGIGHIIGTKIGG